MYFHNLQKRKQLILEISKRYKAYNIRVLGSVARNEATEKSDIDLLVSFEPGASLLDQAGLIDELGKTLGTPVDVVSDRALNRFLRESILKEARPL